MIKEIALLTEIKENIEKSLEGQKLMVEGILNSIINETHFKDPESYAMLSILKGTSRVIEKMLICENQSVAYKLKIETYLDVLYCLKANSVRNIQKEDVEDCKKALDGRHLLSPYYKDIAYLCCTVENIMHNYSLANYRNYKKMFSERIGL